MCLVSSLRLAGKASNWLRPVKPVLSRNEELPLSRISEKNVRFRTRQEICRDVSLVLNDPRLHVGTKYAVVDQVLWVWSEFDGKHTGCKYWSKKARASGSKRGGLVHEHLVPRGIVREKIFALRNPTPTAVRRTLQTWCVGVVVTRDEDDRLNELGLRQSRPDTWDKRNKWARYEEAGIAIAD